jgi:hypothetical protein
VLAADAFVSIKKVSSHSRMKAVLVQKFIASFALYDDLSGNLYARAKPRAIGLFCIVLLCFGFPHSSVYCCLPLPLLFRYRHSFVEPRNASRIPGGFQLESSFVCNHLGRGARLCTKSKLLFDYRLDASRT